MTVNTSVGVSNTPSVLVLGAKGRFGQAAVHAFTEAGWHVTAQARSPASELLPASVQYLQADVLDTATILAAISAVDVVVNAVNPNYVHWNKLLPPITAATITIARSCDALLMIPGNVYNFGAELPAMLCEDTRFDANTDKAALRIQMEQTLADACMQGLRCVVLRAGDFIGGTGTWLDMAITKSLDKAQVIHMGPDHLAHAWAYLPDLAKVFVKVAEQRRQLPAFEVMHYPGITATCREVHAALEQLSGRKLKSKAMTWWAMELLAIFSPFMKAIIKMRYLWERPHQLSGEKLEKLIGSFTTSSLQDALQSYVKPARAMHTD